MKSQQPRVASRESYCVGSTLPVRKKPHSEAVQKILATIAEMSDSQIEEIRDELLIWKRLTR